MNAFSSRPPAVPCLPAAMARDMLGTTGLPHSAITCHTMLSSLDTGSLSVVDSTWPADTCIPSHLHADEDEICVVLSGIAEFRMPERILRRRAGESIVIPRGTQHEVRAVTEVRHIAILTRRGLDAAQRGQP
jgi:mannose-6-phosphate isomerase-like protein (cupin superfamily)